MNNKLFFDCLAPECGRKFATKAKLDEHIRLRHPKKEIKEDKNKATITNLFSQIKNLDNFVNNEAPSLHEHIDIPNVPNYDNMLSDNSDNDDNNTTHTNNTTKQTTEAITDITDALLHLNTKYSSYDDITDITISNKHLLTFMTNRLIPFDALCNVVHLNLSHNEITYSYDIRLLPNLKTCILSHNKIDDLGFTEHLSYIEYIDVENNAITSITSLNKTNKSLQTFKIANNKILYQNSTLKTLHNMKQLLHLTISNNPFLNDIHNYRELFIYKYKTLISLDNISIETYDRDNAKRYMFDHSSQLQSLNSSFDYRPNSSRPLQLNAHGSVSGVNGDGSDDKDVDVDDIGYQTQSQFRVGNNVIVKQSGNSSNSNTKVKLPGINVNVSKKEWIDLQNENKYLKQNEIEHLKEIETLKSEVERLSQLNKEYQHIIETYKNEQHNEHLHYKSKSLYYDENVKLKQQLDSLRKDYNDLLNKTNHTSINNELTNKDIEHDDDMNDDVNDEDIKEDEVVQGVGDGSDDSFDIEEICRKSFQDLKEMRKEVELLNSALDIKQQHKENNKTSNVTTTTSSNKIQPKIMKEDNNTLLQGNILSNRPLILKKGIQTKSKEPSPLAPIKTTKTAFKYGQFVKNNFK